jgi:hypothetical protein
MDDQDHVATGFTLPPYFQAATRFASLEISSDRALAVLALRMTTNQSPRNEPLFTTTPVADLTGQPVSTPLYFPQFADGGGYTTSLILMNTSGKTETGTFKILDDKGAPLDVNPVGGFIGSSFTYTIPSDGIFRFQTDGSPLATRAGWVQLTPDSGTSTPVGAGVFGYNPGNILLTESGIPAAAPSTHARIFVDLSGGHDTGLAVANLTNSKATVAMTAFKSDGTTEAGTSHGSLQLDANGHGAGFVDQLISGLPGGFVGVLDISSATPIALLALRSLNNERNDFLLATFPVADMSQTAPSPIFFPQIADGGGYVTQFILLSAGGASNALLKFYDESGKPIALGK